MTSRDSPEDGYREADHLNDEDAKAILYRLDERTLRIDGQMERIDDRTNRLSARVSEVESRTEENASNVRRNTTIINAVTFGLGGAVATFWAWLQGLLHF